MVKSETENNTTFDHYLDAKGLNCPLPILKSKMLLNKMQPDEVLLVEATDPHSQVDFEAYCARTEHKIVDSTLKEGVYSFTIKRAQNPKKI